MRDKFLIQCGICIIVVLLVSIICFLANNNTKGILSTIYNKMTYSISLSNIEETIASLSNQIDSSNKIDEIESAVLTMAGNGDYPYVENNSKKKILDIYCVDAGIVEKVGVSKAFGQYIIIKHSNSVSKYKHIDQSLVTPGERVSIGKTIGKVKASNDLFSFEIIDNN